MKDGKRGGAAARWARLAACVALVLLFVFLVGPWIASTSPFRPIAEVIERRGINAGGYFYTDVDEFSDAAVHIRR